MAFDPIVVGSTFLALLAGCFLLDIIFVSNHDKTEPVYVRPSIPIVGHLIGIMRQHTEYFAHINFRLPTDLRGIFALPIGSFKMYIVTDRTLVPSIQRAARTISFTPFSIRVNKAICELSDKAAEAHNNRSFMTEIKHAAVHGLSPGASLDQINLDTTNEQLRIMNELTGRAATSSAGDTIDLVEWVQHVVSLSATRGFYGPLNPYSNPEHEKGFWAYNNKLAHIVANLLPNLTAGKALKSKEANGKRYEEYILNKGPDTASRVVQDRTRILEAHGFTLRENALMNAGVDIALLSNYAPTAFWAVFHALSDEKVLEGIREELTASGAVSTSTTTDGETKHTLDISLLRTSCPLILSVLQEAQRFYTAHAHIREITADTTISRTSGNTQPYLLKKGNYLQVAVKPTLRSPEIWGPDPDSFDPYRFMKLRNKDDPTSKLVKPSDLPANAFAVWGMAPHVCPARQFASTGCVSLVALLALRFNFEPVDGTAEGGWKRPKPVTELASLQSPRGGCRVRVKPRSEGAGLWEAVVGTEGTKLPLAIA